MFHFRWSVLCCALALVVSSCSARVDDYEPQEGADDQSQAEEYFGGDPANNAVFALDLSMWEGPVSQWEMDCFWSSGVRHMISGTQVPEITHQQLDMAVRRGMTIDGYVFLYWRNDIEEQVRAGLEAVKDYPLGRFWLDAEEDLQGGVPTVDLMKRAVAACRAHSKVPCGIYTGRGFWTTYLGDTHELADVPLWYAHYNYVRTLSAWPKERFGAWTAPAAKQYAEETLCGVGPDKNVMQVLSTPTVVVDRSAPPAATTAPPAPGILYPRAGERVGTFPLAYLMPELIPGVKLYDIELDWWSGYDWRVYNTWNNTRGDIKSYPRWNDKHYRFRVRGKNNFGAGPWSDFRYFQLGKPTGTAPVVDAGTPVVDAGTPVVDAGTPVVDAGTPLPGAPTNLAPNNMVIYGSSLVISCDPVPGATRYEFAIDYDPGTGMKPYYTYVGSTPSRTFSPQVHGATYRFRVRAEVGGAFGNPSLPATFEFE